MRANQSWQTTNFLPLIITAGIVLMFLYATIHALQTVQLTAHQAQLASGTEGLLKQTAIHLSKMEGGVSIGGFPGFEPPDDDEKYRDKIRNKNYSPRDVNDWVKEINNFLKQIIKKNPRMTLEEILTKQGLTAKQIEEFTFALKDTELAARGMARYGVDYARALALRELLIELGVSLW